LWFLEATNDLAGTKFVGAGPVLWGKIGMGWRLELNGQYYAGRQCRAYLFIVTQNVFSPQPYMRTIPTSFQVNLWPAQVVGCIPES
jgi:hypothetical protein